MKGIVLTLAIVTTTTAAHADTDWHLWGGVAALGLGAASLGVTYYQASRVRANQNDETFHAYRGSFPPNADVCAEARAGNEGASPSAVSNPRAAYVADLCDSTRTLETAQWIFFGTGLALITTGIVLIATRPKSKETVALVPAIGPRGSTMTLTVRF